MVNSNLLLPGFQALSQLCSYANWLPDWVCPESSGEDTATVFVPHWRKLAIKRFGNWFRVSKLMDVGTVFKPTQCGPKPIPVSPVQYSRISWVSHDGSRDLCQICYGNSIVSVFVCLLMSVRLSQLVIHGTFIIANIHSSEKEWLNLSWFCNPGPFRLSWMGWWTLIIARRSPHKAGFPKKRCETELFSHSRFACAFPNTSVMYGII